MRYKNFNIKRENNHWVVLKYSGGSVSKRMVVTGSLVEFLEDFLLREAKDDAELIDVCSGLQTAMADLAHAISCWEVQQRKRRKVKITVNKNK